jgi:hypothetical protein
MIPYWPLHGKNAKAVALENLSVSRNPHEVILLPLSLFMITKITQNSHFEATINFVELPSDLELRVCRRSLDISTNTLIISTAHTTSHMQRNVLAEDNYASLESVSNHNSLFEYPTDGLTVSDNSNITLCDLFESAYPPNYYRINIEWKENRQHFET